MKATPPIASTSARQGLSTGTVCCGVPPLWAATGGWVPAVWANAYHRAFETAAAQLASSAHRRRLLGHYEPSLN